MLLVSVFLCCVGAIAESRISKIEISGNERTRKNVILRELSFQVGTRVEEAGISDHLLTSRNRLMNLNLFNEVEIGHNLVDGDFQIRIEVVEKWFIWPIPSIEFSDRNFNVWQDLNFDPERTNYGLYLFNYNLFGANHSLKLSYIRGYNQKYGLEYRIPFFSPESKWGVDFKFQHHNQNELWHKTEADQLVFFKGSENGMIKENELDLTLHRRLDLFTNWSIALRYNQVVIADEVLQEPSSFSYLLGGASEQNQISLRTEWQYDTRDNRFFPIRGEELSLGMAAERYATDRIKGNFAMDVEWNEFNQIAKKFYTAFSVYGHWNSYKLLGYHDYKILGYDYNMRGFERYVSDGHAGFLMRTALRYHLLDISALRIKALPTNYEALPINVFLSYFAEYGRTVSDRVLIENELPNSNLASMGIGLNCLFYNDRVLRFEYSYNSLNQSGLYIHFKRAI